MSVRFLSLWCVALLALSFVSRAQFRAGAGLRCALDGVAIVSTARVDLFEGTELVHSFCSAECALAWPRKVAASSALHFQVRAEQDGRPLDPRAACFVRSNLNERGGRPVLRAFVDAVSAAEHARSFGGALVPNPFPENP